MADPILYRRGRIWWTRVEGKRVSTGCRDRQAALLKARQLERQGADPVHGAAAHRSLGDAVADFLTELRSRGAPEGTRVMYTQKCGQLIRFFKADLPLARLDAGAVDRFISHRRAGDEGVSDSTIHKELVSLRQVLKRERRAGRYDREPSQVLPVSFAPNYKPRRTFHTRSQADLLLVTLRADRAAYVAFHLATGARRGEARRAKRSDVNWTARTVQLWGTKTEAAEDIIPILLQLESLLRFALDNAPGDEVLFPHPWLNVYRDLRVACEATGIPVVNLNDLRRSVGTWLRIEGAEPHLIGAFLRHTSSAMAEKVYAKLDARQLGALLSPAKPARRAR